MLQNSQGKQPDLKQHMHGYFDYQIHYQSTGSWALHKHQNSNTSNPLLIKFILTYVTMSNNCCSCSFVFYQVVQQEAMARVSFKILSGREYKVFKVSETVYFDCMSRIIYFPKTYSRKACNLYQMIPSQSRIFAKIIN